MAGTELALPDPQTLALAQVPTVVAQVGVLCVRLRETQDAAGAEELRRRLAAYEKYLADKKAQKSLEAEMRRVEALIGELSRNGSKLDLSKADSDRFRKLAEHASLVEELLDAGITKRAQLLREIDRHVAEKERIESVYVPDLRQGDFRDSLSDVDGVDVVLCDPPYSAEYVPLYGDLGRWAASALNDEGVLAVMTGQTHLPAVIEELGKSGLPYRWMLAYLTPGGQAVQVFPRKVNTFWKPVLVYGASREWFGDVAKSAVNDNDKSRHEWGQSLTGMADLLSRLAQPGDLVADPMMGAGTTGQAAMELGCRFIGCDFDTEAAEKRLVA